MAKDSGAAALAALLGSSRAAVGSTTPTTARCKPAAGRGPRAVRGKTQPGANGPMAPMAPQPKSAKGGRTRGVQLGSKSFITKSGTTKHISKSGKTKGATAKGLEQTLLATKPVARKYKNGAVPIAERSAKQARSIRSGGGRARIAAALKIRKAPSRAIQHKSVLEGLPAATVFTVMAEWIDQYNAGHIDCPEGCVDCPGIPTFEVRPCLNTPMVKEISSSLEAFQLLPGKNGEEVVRVTPIDVNDLSKGKKLIAKTFIPAGQAVLRFHFTKIAKGTTLLPQKTREYSVNLKDGSVGIPIIGKNGWKFGAAQYLNHACSDVATVKLVESDLGVFVVARDEPLMVYTLNPKP